jgi:H+/Cl- antiporter ClcA
MLRRVTDRARARSLVELLVVSAVLGVVIGAGFVGFEQLLHGLQHLLWVEWIGDEPSPWATIALATAGGAALGLALMLAPGRGGHHPADGHELIPQSADTSLGPIVGGIVVGLIGLVGGASLGPEGAILPAAAGISILVTRRLRLGPGPAKLVQMAGLGALLAAMFGNPLAGAIPLMEVAAMAAPSMPMLLLPSLTAGSTAVLTLRVLDVPPLGALPFEYEPFRTMHLVWAVVVGVAAGFGGLLIDRLVPVLRRITRVTDARHVLLTTTAAGFLLGVLYAIGGTEVRFSGIPELVAVVADTDGVGAALGIVAIKIVATALCLAAGYRGGKIFPVAFVGGGTGLALHLLIDGVPLYVAVAVGIASAMVTAMRLPATAALTAASILSPVVLPIALLGLVAAYAVHLLADHLTSLESAPAPSAPV